MLEHGAGLAYVQTVDHHTERPPVAAHTRVAWAPRGAGDDPQLRPAAIGDATVEQAVADGEGIVLKPGADARPADDFIVQQDRNVRPRQARWTPSIAEAQRQTPAR